MFVVFVAARAVHDASLGVDDFQMRRQIRMEEAAAGLIAIQPAVEHQQVGLDAFLERWPSASAFK